MKKYTLAILALIVGGMAVSAFGQVSPLLKKTITKTETFPVSPGATVSVTGGPLGSIRVVGTSKNEISIVTMIDVQAPTEAALTELSGMTGYVLDESPLRVSILTIGPHNKFGLKKLPKNFPRSLLALPTRVDYVITVPRYIELEIDGGKGDLSVENVEGTMRINFIESNAKIGIVGGNTIVSIGSGDVVAAFATRGWRASPVNISVVLGNLTVLLPTKLNAELDATILKSGVIDNKLTDLKPRDRKLLFTEKSIIAKSGVGGVPLKFSVADGSLTLARSDRPL